MTGQPASDFAVLLRQLRAESRLTQEELAEQAGVSLRTVQDLEEGRHRTSHRPTAERLAGALGLTGRARPLFVRVAGGRAAAADVLTERAAEADRVPAGADGHGPAADGHGPVAPVPRELPADVGAFTGRAAELAALDALLPAARPDGPPGPVVISAVSGTAGAGKTALAVHWAHRVATRFPDGQLYVNLRGYDPGQPVAATEALEGFLGALGTAGPDIPAGEAARAARYRSLLNGRRLLVVLDNAATEEQVRPLLPGSPSVMVLVTSRDTLPGLVARDGARRLDLDLLPADDAVALLGVLIGDRVDAEPAAAQALASLCARLPLALRVAAELAAERPGRPLDELAEELASETDRLDLLAAGSDPRGAVAGVLSWSFRHLPADSAQMFRLLGLHPGQHWDRHAAAALAGTTPARAGQVLGVLARTHLIQPAGPGRYDMHDLLRVYAADQVTHDPPEANREALTRLFGYYVDACTAAVDGLAVGGRPARPHGPPEDTPAPVPRFADRADARAWLEAELANLVAVAAHAAGHGWPGQAIRLADTLRRYLDGINDTAGLAICRHALDAAVECGDRAAQARTLTTQGLIYGRQGRYAQAADCHRQALALARAAGDRRTEGWALGNLALIDDQQGRYPQAVRSNRQALTLYRELGDASGEAVTLSNLGLVYLRQGRYPQAARQIRQAIGLYREVGHRVGEAIALTNLGEVCSRQADYGQAVEHQAHALALSRELGARRVEAWALTRIGKIRHGQDRYEEALAGHQQALELFREVGDRDGEAEALNAVGETLLATGRLDQARASHNAALVLTRQTGDKHEQARALTRLSEIYARQGQHDRARSYREQALAIYTGLGVPEAQEMRTVETEFPAVSDQPPA